MKKNRFYPIDWHLLIPVCILAFLSLTTLFSLNAVLFRNQLINFGLALVIFLVFSQVDYKLFQPLTKPIYVISIILLVVILLLGFESRGAVRWIDFFGISIQLSETLKPFLTISLAGFLAAGNKRTFKNFLLVFLLVAPIVGLINLQPDLGNGLIYLGALLLTLLTFGYPILWFVILAIPVLIASPFLWQVLHDYQRQRIMTFIHPTSDPLGTSYNVIQAMIAVGSGMIIGRGMGEGTQSGLQFLPERHTDFIFATISEGFGFLGSLVIIVTYGYLLYRIYQIMRHVDDTFGRVFTAGAFFFILIHFFVNVGMNVALIPVVGITLPFVSYGGSSIISSAIFLGILSAISREHVKEKVLEIR